MLRLSEQTRIRQRVKRLPWAKVLLLVAYPATRKIRAKGRVQEMAYKLQKDEGFKTALTTEAKMYPQLRRKMGWVKIFARPLSCLRAWIRDTVRRNRLEKTGSRKNHFGSAGFQSSRL